MKSSAFWKARGLVRCAWELVGSPALAAMEPHPPIIAVDLQPNPWLPSTASCKSRATLRGGGRWQREEGATASSYPALFPETQCSKLHRSGTEASSGRELRRRLRLLKSQLLTQMQFNKKRTIWSKTPQCLFGPCLNMQGKAFLKSHTEYRRQHMKMYKNYCTVREWFLPGSNDFVDQVLQSSSLRWNKVLRKEITKYCEEKRKSGKKKDLIKTLDFGREGISLRWKTGDIVRHVFTIKKYRRSSKGKKSQIYVHGDQATLPSVALELSTGAYEVEATPEVPTCVAEDRLGKQPRVRNPSLKVREQAS